MVFASLLLRQLMAYGGAALSVLMLSGGLYLTGQLPHLAARPTASSLQGYGALAGWLVMLTMTVYVANHITRSLHEHRRRLLVQNARIRRMSSQLRRQRQAMAQSEKMVALGQMAAGVAHEIANPLACLDSMLQLAQRKPDRASPDTIIKLREQVGRINQIVQQMTRFAHPDQTAFAVVSVAQVVESALQMVRFDHRIRGVELRQEIAADAGSIRVQPHALEQVLLNFMINALDAMEGRPAPRLEIRAWRHNGECFIQVGDNGSGIPPEHIDRIFEPFFTTKPVGRGTGLGLSISYSLIRGHGGQIDVDSAPEAGARFTIRLPAS
jgi:C4-dicarboxylate-specific signal transduction histidine kinase